MLRYFKLRGKMTVPCSMLECAEFLETPFENRVVAKTQIAGAEVSTVFLGIDHNFHPDGPPLVFGFDLDGETRRYSTWEEAEAGHAEIVEEVKTAMSHRN